ncbi:MAG: iron-sulfur cluster carrier protein [Pirellulaceae bacterium]|nr:MAG: iron-sulfur cluster carrier protein [Pirellulaceae bacterium]
METTQIRDRLRTEVGQLRDPETGRSLQTNDQLGAIEVDHTKARITVRLSSHSRPISDAVKARVEEAARVAVPELTDVEVVIEPLERPPVPLGQLGLPVKSVIAVGSGKGGVGKSTVAAALAISLADSGARVGLMDADVYGPSLPHLLGISGRPEVVNGKIQPIYFEQIPVMSMGFLVEPDQAVIWRGPMLHGSITQFLRDTYWGALDYLIIDMPPGTGDVALTLSQLLPLTGAVVVCTPQQVALLDAIKAVSMFRKTKIPMLGIVENMSGFVCPQCNKQYDIFGRGGAREKAEELGVPFLGELPINIALREQSDAGQLAAAARDPVNAAALRRIVFALVEQVAQQAAAKPHGPTLPVL